jgi:hypothetical protein
MLSCRAQCEPSCETASEEGRIMSRKFVVKSDSYGERVYLRMFGRGRYGSKFGLVRSPAEATAFSSRFEAGAKAGRAGNVIMRAFNAVELDATPAATTRPHIAVRITA